MYGRAGKAHRGALVLGVVRPCQRIAVMDGGACVSAGVGGRGGRSCEGSVVYVMFVGVFVGGFGES